MKVQNIINLLNGRVLSGKGMLNHEVEFAFASDLMSDVLTVSTNGLLLLTGLANIQAIRTAEMSDISCVVIVRNKKVSDEMIELANENGIVLIECPYSMFRASGLLFCNGLKPIF